MTMPSDLRRSQSGQIGIIIILIMIVLLTIGLSIASRSSNEVNSATQEEESTRVFNAAEAGIQRALSTDLTFKNNQLHPNPTNVPSANATVDYSITKVQSLETRLFQGVTAHVQLQDPANAPTVNTLTIEWAKENNCGATSAPASLLVSIYSLNRGTSPPTATVRHLTFGACNTHGDNIAVVGTSGSNGYYKSASIAIGPTDAFVRIMPVYNDTAIRVTGSGGTGALPVQYYNIVSTGKNQNGTESRTVQVNRTLDTEPTIMDFVLFSGNTLSQ